MWDGMLMFNKYFEVLERLRRKVQLLREAVGLVEDVIDMAE